MLNHKQEKNDRESEERTDYFENRGLVNAMQSMKDIEALFDKVTSNYRPLLNGERLCCS